MFGLGVVYTMQKDVCAVETWNQYIKMSGGSATAYNNLGFCQELAGNPAAAEKAYHDGLTKDPSNEPCHVNYGLMLARRKINEGLMELQKVLTPAKAHYDLAAVYDNPRAR